MKKIALLIAASFLLFTNCNKEFVLPEEKTLNVGDAAQYFIQSKIYKKLVVEIGYVDGYQPNTASVTSFISFLENYLNKPDGISYKMTQISSPGVNSYDVQRLLDIEETNRTEFAEGEKIAAFFFFADAGFHDDTQNKKTLGIAYRGTSMAIFQKTIQDFTGGIGQPTATKVETTIMNHEFGHLMGLVGTGTPMQVSHMANGHHCDDQNCLMYYATETNAIFGNLIGSPVPDLDANCRNDIKAAGGK